MKRFKLSYRLDRSSCNVDNCLLDEIEFYIKIGNGIFMMWLLCFDFVQNPISTIYIEFQTQQ